MGRCNFEGRHLLWTRKNDFRNYQNICVDTSQCSRRTVYKGTAITITIFINIMITFGFEHFLLICENPTQESQSFFSTVNLSQQQLCGARPGTETNLRVDPRHGSEFIKEQRQRKTLFCCNPITEQDQLCQMHGVQKYQSWRSAGGHSVTATRTHKQVRACFRQRHT